MANRDTAKQWFKRKMKPSENQFSQLFDFLRFKDEGIDMNDVTGLTDALQHKADTIGLPEKIQFDGDGFYNLLAGYVLERVIVLPSADCSVMIGNNAGSDDLAPETPITSAQGQVILLNVFALANRQIHFTGIPANTYIIFIKSKVQ